MWSGCCWELCMTTSAQCLQSWKAVLSLINKFDIEWSQYLANLEQEAKHLMMSILQRPLMTITQQDEMIWADYNYCRCRNDTRIVLKWVYTKHQCIFCAERECTQKSESKAAHIFTDNYSNDSVELLINTNSILLMWAEAFSDDSHSATRDKVYMSIIR